MTDLGDQIAFALELADVADQTTLPRFQANDLLVEQKPDLTPVSDADRSAERAMLGLLAKARPGHSVLGEELGSMGSGPWQWILDPIDGTMNFVRGIPVWATLIALLQDGEPVLSVVSAPALGRRWWAARGRGAFADGRHIMVSGVDRIEDCQVVLGSEREVAAAGWKSGMDRLSEQAGRVRGFGDFWSHMLVAEGAADVAVDVGVKSWDMAAVIPIVEEAGGRFTDLDGVRDHAGGTGLSTNGHLHDEVLELFGR